MSTATEETPVQGLVQGRQHSLITRLSERYGVEARQFFDTVKKTLMPSNKVEPSNEELIAFLLVADKYNLDPFTKEIYAFPAKGGGITPVVGVDGWIKIANREASFDGMTVNMETDEHGKPVSATCVIHRKDRSHPITITEFYEECKRQTDPWNSMPRRMLRHKAIIQCVRVAFGVSGIMDEDEAHDVQEVDARVVDSAVKAASVTGKIAAARQRQGIPPAAAPERPVPPVDTEPPTGVQAELPVNGEGEISCPPDACKDYAELFTALTRQPHIMDTALATARDKHDECLRVKEFCDIDHTNEIQCGLILTEFRRLSDRAKGK